MPLLPALDSQVRTEGSCDHGVCKFCHGAHKKFFFSRCVGYVYPDSIGEGGICDMYQGVPCLVDNTKCCYNEALWCPNGSPNCDRYDRAAYPEGDMRIYKGQMSDPLALSPFPNSLMYNWATILILGLGNLAALDFQVRCMASNSPQTAVRGCLIGGFVTVLIGVPFTYLGSITR
jgi:hypothetical protein